MQGEVRKKNSLEEEEPPVPLPQPVETKNVKLGPHSSFIWSVFSIICIFLNAIRDEDESLESSDELSPMSLNDDVSDLNKGWHSFPSQLYQTI